MKKAAYPLLLAAAIAGAFLAGSWYNQRTVARQASAGGRKVLHYVCPMHPQYTSGRPGTAPCCGMRLEPVYAVSGPPASGGSVIPSPAPPGTVNISPEKQQRMGVRVSQVEKASGTHTLRLFGRVAPDETRIYRLLAGVEGFLRNVSTVTTGSQVDKDQWLATFSAPDSRSPIQAYLVTLDVVDRQRQGGADNPASMKAAQASSRQAVDRLINMGMSSLQIEEIRRTREVPTEIRITSPANGFVLARNVSPGQKFERGTEWYRIADLNRVWILADVFENEAQYLRPGVRAQMYLPNQKKTLPARVGEVLPQFDGATRTLKTRLEADNPGFILRPDMFVDVELPISFPPTLSVPSDAVLDSGLKKTVFVDRGEGFFEPRPVETGWRLGDRIEIVRGLAPGERIVVSGTFLVDSESRMRLAGQNKERDPVCGMEVDPAKAAASIQHQGKTYHFCSKTCKEKFVGRTPRSAAGLSGVQS